tara:strand:+ start:5186 stop:5578 length:393 start_codon:yes stop_codon:yes gene_type:complete
MSEKKNWDKIAKIEKAIKEKYGEDVIRHPKQEWTDEQEAAYLEDLKELAAKEKAWRINNEKVEIESGVFVSKKLLKREDSNSRVCPMCETYSFDLKDNLYMTKYECCWSCYINHIEGREEEDPTHAIKKQ